MNELPTIQSLGLPPEKHADRIVAAMLRVMVKHRAQVHPRTQAILAQKFADGNPAAQERLYKKLQESIGGFSLGGHLTTGKRGRYLIQLFVLDGWDAERKDVIFDPDVIPDKPWIALTVVSLQSKGDFRYEETSGISLFITHHALSRLTQRCGARTMKQVYGSVRRIAMTYIREYASHAKTAHERETMRVELPYDLGVAICGLSHYADDEGGIVVATLWNEGEGLKPCDGCDG